MSNHSVKPARLLAAAGAAAFALLGAGCQSGQIHNNVMNSSAENDLGRDYASQIDSQVKFVMDGKVNRRVLDIATPIFAQAQKERPDVSFRIRVIDSPEVNAFSIPGGYVYIYRGLMDKIGSDDDALACVIGHESAHVVRRHVVKSISDSENKGFLVDVATLLARDYRVGQVGGALFELDQLHYSRVAEFEADRWGEKFAYNAGYDPHGMIRTFQTFERMEQPDAPDYALDHPINPNRILRVEEQLRELRANHGQYLEEAYSPTDDKLAADKNHIDYPAPGASDADARPPARRPEGSVCGRLADPGRLNRPGPAAFFRPVPRHPACAAVRVGSRAGPANSGPGVSDPCPCGERPVSLRLGTRPTRFRLPSAAPARALGMKVAAIVPAYNEAGRIGAVLHALTASPDVDEVPGRGRRLLGPDLGRRPGRSRCPRHHPAAQQGQGRGDARGGNPDRRRCAAVL